MSYLQKEDWAVCKTDFGFGFENSKKSIIATHFNNNTVVRVLKYNTEESLIYNVERNEQFIVSTKYLEKVDVFKTGKGFKEKICNKCFVLKPMNEFDVNQTDAKGNKTTRPSCRVCRLDIDKRLLSSSEINIFKKNNRPSDGDLFKCPICEKRGYICDSCNTGLGRFKNGKNYLKNALKYIESFKTK